MVFFRWHISSGLFLYNIIKPISGVRLFTLGGSPVAPRHGRIRNFAIAGPFPR